MEKITLTNASTLKDMIGKVEMLETPTLDEQGSARINGKHYRAYLLECGTMKFVRMQCGAIKGRDGRVRRTKRRVCYYKYSA